MSSPAHPFGLTHLPGDPSFRNSAVNAVAVIPLLSTDKDGNVRDSRSADSFRHLLTALQRHNNKQDNLLLVIPNSSLTRPGDWKYSDTPLRGLHWQHGCQRLLIFDGRPDASRQAHDRLMNHQISRDWIDLCPSRRTAAVVGVLNMHDCHTQADWQLAREELKNWVNRYSVPPYEVTAHGRAVERDQPVVRLFVYDSFEDAQKLEWSSGMGNSVLAFPPTDEAHATMMDLHMNVVVNDLAVAIFCDIETKIRESDAIASNNSAHAAAASTSTTTTARRSLTRIISGSSSEGSAAAQNEPSPAGKTLSLSSMAGLVSPTSKLAKESPQKSGEDAADDADMAETTAEPDESSKTPQKKTTKPPLDKPPTRPASTPLLLTPLDDSWELSELSARDLDSIRKRDLGRREKYAADLSLLAGSPLDAYERYLKAAEHGKSGTLDPLWYAASLEGCATAHIAMAEAGGYSIDDYLDNNFQLPDELMAFVKKSPEEKRPASNNKQTLPDVIFALCEEALDIVSRHPRLAPYHAELLLKLAWYASDTAESHLRCRWGEPSHCYHGEPSDPPRWERTVVHGFQFEPFGNSSPIRAEVYERTQKICELLHTATALRSLDPATRVDVASQALVLCLQGVKPMEWNGPGEMVVLPRKAAFFASVAADAVSETSVQYSGKLWLLATQLYAKTAGESYGWGALRAACLGALSNRGNNLLSLEAAEHLLALLCELNPDMEDTTESSEEVEEKNEQAEGDDLLVGDSSAHGSSSAPRSEQERSSTTANLFARQLREGYHQMKATSTFVAQQSKWSLDDPLPPQLTPLGDTSEIGSKISSLNCVWSKSDRSHCTAAQMQCMSRISTLRRILPSSSSGSGDLVEIYGQNQQPGPPVYVESATAIESDSQLEVQKIKSAEKSDEGAMATFFNPFEKKRQAGGSKPATSVAEGEEHAFLVKLGNRLAVPLEVKSSALEFKGKDLSRVKSTSLSFVIPPKSTNFAISFPFTVLPRSDIDDDFVENSEEFEVSGLELTCLGRSFSLPIKPSANCTEKMVAESIVSVAAENRRQKETENKEETDHPASFPMQAYPCQPSLHIYYADTLTPVETISVALGDGETYLSPPIQLECYTGPSGSGKVEQLEIHLAGLTGASQRLFDTYSDGPKHTVEDDTSDLFEKENSPPLRVRVLAEKLSLDCVNGSSNDGRDSDNQIRIQAIASHRLLSRLEDETRLQLRFRYRGKTNKLTQVWRNHKVGLSVKLSKGPRITCLSVCPDLHQHSYFAEFAQIMRLRARKPDEQETVGGDKEEDIRVRVGQRSNLDVSVGLVGILVTVLNETRSDIKLFQKQDNAILGLKHVTCRPLVSVKIPMFLNRQDLEGQSVAIEDIVSNMTTTTELWWESDNAKGSKAGGRIRLHRGCLEQLLKEHESVASTFCDPPCSIGLSVNGSKAASTPMKCSPGSPGVSLALQAAVSKWLPDDDRQHCNVKLELFCFREDVMGSSEERSHVWAGKLRHRTSMASKTLAHQARVLFCRPGQYLLSGCVRIHHEYAEKGTEEVWLAPVAQRVIVEHEGAPTLYS